MKLLQKQKRRSKKLWRKNVEITTIKNKKQLARDRMVNLRVSWRELALLRAESMKRKESVSELIRKGFLDQL